jgi:hypothetical protein
MKKLMLVAPLVLAFACTNIKYIGDSYPSTTHVDLFYSENDVERDYKVMGHLSASAGEFVSVEKMVEEIKKKAMEKGADGIIILGLEEHVVGQSVDYTSTTETKGNKTTETGKTTTSTSKENQIKAIFIKYREPDESPAE